MRRRDKRKADEQHWQVSYIDLLTAMLASFTLLLALSVPDQSKLDSLASSVTEAAKQQANLGTLSKELLTTIEKNSSLKGQVNVVMTDAGIELRFGSNLLFPPGKAALRPEGYRRDLQHREDTRVFREGAQRLHIRGRAYRRYAAQEHR